MGRIPVLTRLPWAIAATAVATGLLLGAGRRRKRSPAGAEERAAGQQPADDEGAFGEPRASDEPHARQVARARQSGRGREAAAPWHIPWKGWKDILLRVYAEAGKDRLMAVAAGVVFYSLLALFPAVTALVSSYGLFADARTISDHLSALAGMMPAGGFDIVRDQIARVVAKGGGQLSATFLFGLGLALWSANAGMKAIFDALNIIYDEDEKRSFIRLNLVSLAFTLGAIATALVAVSAVIVLPLVFAGLGIDSARPWLVALLRWPLLFVMIVTGLALLYRFGPSRRKAKWRWVSGGSLFAAFAWIAGSLAFSHYLSSFADYSATYGSLGAVIGLMMWMWLSSIVILLGAELNAEIEHQTAQDTTVGKRRPLGRRGATMADTVGHAATERGS